MSERSDAEVRWREEFQRAVQRRMEAKGWPRDWAPVLAGECLMALDERGFGLIPPIDLDPVAIDLGLTRPPRRASMSEYPENATASENPDETQAGIVSRIKSWWRRFREWEAYGKVSG